MSKFWYIISELTVILIDVIIAIITTIIDLFKSDKSDIKNGNN